VEAVSFSETSANIYWTTRFNIPKASHSHHRVHCTIYWASWILSAPPQSISLDSLVWFPLWILAALSVTDGPHLSFKLLSDEDSAFPGRPASALSETPVRTELVAFISVVHVSSYTRASILPPSRESSERYLTDLEVRSFIVLTMRLAPAVPINNTAVTVLSCRQRSSSAFLCAFRTPLDYVLFCYLRSLSFNINFCFKRFLSSFTKLIFLPLAVNFYIHEETCRQKDKTHDFSVLFSFYAFGAW
jgi:hypothetical protein